MYSAQQKCDYCDQLGHYFTNCNILLYDVENGIVSAKKAKKERAYDKNRETKCEFCGAYGHIFTDCKILISDVENGIINAQIVAEKCCEYCFQHGHSIMVCEIFKSDVENNIVNAQIVAERCARDKEIYAYNIRQNAQENNYQHTAEITNNYHNYKKKDNYDYLKKQNNIHRPTINLDKVAKSRSFSMIKHNNGKENNCSDKDEQMNHVQNSTDSKQFNNICNNLHKQTKVQTVKKENFSNAKTIANIRFLRIKNNLPIVQFENSKKLIRGKTTFLIDESAEISVIKISRIDPETFIDKKITHKIAGVTRGECSTLGKVVISLDGQNVALHTVPDTFPINAQGLIGKDVLSKQPFIQEERLAIPAHVRRVLDAIDKEKDLGIKDKIISEKSVVLNVNFELTNDERIAINEIQSTTKSENVQIHQKTIVALEKSTEINIELCEKSENTRTFVPLNKPKSMFNRNEISKTFALSIRMNLEIITTKQVLLECRDANTQILITTKVTSNHEQRWLLQLSLVKEARPPREKPPWRLMETARNRLARTLYVTERRTNSN